MTKTKNGSKNAPAKAPAAPATPNPAAEIPSDTEIRDRAVKLFGSIAAALSYAVDAHETDTRARAERAAKAEAARAAKRAWTPGTIVLGRNGRRHTIVAVLGEDAVVQNDDGSKALLCLDRLWPVEDDKQTTLPAVG